MNSFVAVVVVFVLACSVVVAVNGATAADGSRCPNTSCSPPIPGASCRASYEREDGCCPVWYCTQNGVTSQIYGKSTGASGTSFSSWSSSSSTGGVLPQIKLPNIFGAGGLFG